MNKLILSLLFSLLCLSTHSKTVINVGSIFNADNGTLQPDMSILIEDDRVSEVIEGFIDPEADDIYIDLSAYYVLPGLIDMHVHLTNQS